MERLWQKLKTNTKKKNDLKPNEDYVLRFKTHLNEFHGHKIKMQNIIMKVSEI